MSREKAIEQYNNIIDSNPQHYGWEKTFKYLKEDLETYFGQYQSVKITIANKDKLPVLLNEIPDYFLNSLMRKPDYFKLRFHYFDVTLEDDDLGNCGSKYLFKTNGKWIYAEHFPGSGNGYKCCEQLHIFIGETLKDLQFHVSENDLEDLLPNDENHKFTQ